MRILFATPYKCSTGGIAQWAENIISHYNQDKKFNCELDILPINDISKKSIVIGRSYIQRIYYGLKTYTNVLKEQKLRLSHNNYDILHISSSASISLAKDYLMIKMAQRHDVKTIIHFHFGRIPQLSQKRNWEWKLLLKVAKMATAVILMDEASYNTLKSAGLTNIHLVPNPLGSKIRGIADNDDIVARDEQTITFVGHIVKTKGVFELIAACKDIPNIKVRLIGPVVDDVKSSLINLSGNADWLSFVGQIPIESVIKEMKSCGVFVLPTYTEGFPNVILESMACGCPIITTPVGAIPEMLQINSERPCGVCVEPRNVSQLRDAIIDFISNPAKAQEYGRLARERVINAYSIESVWSKMNIVWNNVL